MEVLENSGGHNASCRCTRRAVNFALAFYTNPAPVAPPWIVSVEDGYLVDPTWDPEIWPTYREHLDYASLSVEEKAEQLITLFSGYDGDAEGLEADLEISMPKGGWDDASLIQLEKEFGDSLDDSVDAQHLGFWQNLTLGPHAVGAYLLDQLPDAEQQRLGLVLVEGEYPGSDFCGVWFDGNLDELNESLALHGLNVIVKSHSPA